MHYKKCSYELKLFVGHCGLQDKYNNGILMVNIEFI
jgi:hypothetical protein